MAPDRALGFDNLAREQSGLTYAMQSKRRR